MPHWKGFTTASAATKPQWTARNLRPTRSTRLTRKPAAEAEALPPLSHRGQLDRSRVWEEFCQARSQPTLHKKSQGKGQSSYRLAAPPAATSMTCVAYQLDAKSAHQQSWPAIKSHSVNQECPEHPTVLECVPVPAFPYQQICNQESLV